MYGTILLLTISSLALAQSSAPNTRRENGICSWMMYKNSTCPRVNLLCDNKRCIARNLYCNGRNDCGDNSDEHYCNDYYNCPNYGKKRCGNSNRCVPTDWFCDGILDCPNGEDEQNCDGKSGDDLTAIVRGVQWLYNQSKPESATETWGSSVGKSAVALYFADPRFTACSNGTRKEIAYEVSLQLLSQLFKNKLQNIPSEDLASFVNAFLVSCLDPRKFRGIDLVQELRRRANQQNYTTPYVFLALCNAGETITESDKEKLVDTFWNKRRTFWTDTQAIVVMALACANNQSGNKVDTEVLHDLTAELKQHQYVNGSVENLQTTALVMQALIAAETDVDPDSFDERKAIQQILQHQKPDGSFGNLMNTYYVLPVLNCRSLVSISSSHCQSVHTDEITALDNLMDKDGPKIRVQYSLWIGDKKDLERYMALRVPANMSFYGIMEIAAEIDSRFRFEYVVKNRKPYVNAISGIQDNPEKGTFWFLYAVIGGKPSAALESPAEVIPKHNEHYAMWYRSGTWID